MLNNVIDLSHHNRILEYNKVNGDGIFGIIHKATQGFRFKDPKYASRRPKSLEVGLRWGAYHFGTGGDGVAQAEFFLSVVNPSPNDLLVLDYEKNPQGSSMTIDEAEEFVEYIHEKTGRWPGFYTGNFIKGELKNRKDTPLANCWLWFARYGRPPVIPMQWKKWAMWQYTDGAAGDVPHFVNGIGNCDRDKFNGTMDELKKLWGE